MGWSDCGYDSQGRPIGYSFEATCDHEGCNERIDRGLSFACGDMHGETEIGCEKYFCGDHRANTVFAFDRYYSVCDDCKRYLLLSEEWKEDEMEGCLVQVAPDNQQLTDEHNNRN